MGDIEIRGGRQADEIARAFEKAAVKGLRRELQAGLTAATKPMRRAAKESALQRLPKRGGLNVLVSKARMSTRAGNLSVRIVATGMDQLELIDKGKVVHPVYGHGPRVVQSVPEGWFTEPMEESAPVVRRELAAAIDTVARQIEAAGG